jgi:hypothetical protein
VVQLFITTSHQERNATQHQRVIDSESVVSIVWWSGKHPPREVALNRETRSRRCTLTGLESEDATYTLLHFLTSGPVTDLWEVGKTKSLLNLRQ